MNQPFTPIYVLYHSKGMRRRHPIRCLAQLPKVKKTNLPAQSTHYPFSGWTSNTV